MLSNQQTLGAPVENWHGAPFPAHTTHLGQHCTLEPINIEQHAQALYQANALDIENRMWTYLPYGPFTSFDAYREWLQDYCYAQDPQFYAVVIKGQATGLTSYLRVDTKNGVIEIGHLAFSSRLQRTTAATEAIYLMIKNAFDLGYRRVEWKCNALNTASKSAALRLGMCYEGTLRQTGIVKGRNRDTAWFSILDKEWPTLQKAFQTWLDPLNFDDSGIQKESLSQLTAQFNKSLKR